MHDGHRRIAWRNFPLEDIQANILLPHGREHHWFLFLQFHGSPTAIGRWCKELASGKHLGITTAAKQYEDALKRKYENPTFDGGVVTSLALSAAGMQQLGFTEPELPPDPCFKKGMRHGLVNSSLRDIPSHRWEGNYKAPIHACISIADNDPAALEVHTGKIVQSLKGHGVLGNLFLEKGCRLKRNGYDIEPFGYRDGISQIQFWDRDFNLVSDTALSVALIQNSPNPLFDHGSYLVFRKLEQNVKAFSEKIDALSRLLGMRKEEVEAQVMGRYKDGMPISLQHEGKWPKDPFDFSNDQEGRTCPFHAHIRKANPRLPGLERHQIIRRGIPYDHRPLPISSEPLPSRDVGLLFVCYQASIEEQFCYIQREWMNNAHYPPAGNGEGNSVGVDPISGQYLTGKQAQRWSGKYNRDHTFDLSNVVNLKGGEFFFVPPVSLFDQEISPDGSQRRGIQPEAPDYPGRRGLGKLGRFPRY